jgi:hypothetical protein
MVNHYKNQICLGYIPAGPLGLTGGYLRAGAIGAQMNQMQDLHAQAGGIAPKMFKLGPSTDGILAFRVSRDVAYAAVALASGHLNVYRVRQHKA